MNMDLLERLENWRGQHKSNACNINHDDGYGASCWEVELQSRDRKICVVSGRESDREHRNTWAFGNDIGKMTEDSEIAGYKCYTTVQDYTYVIGKDGKEPTLKDLLTVALAYMEQI